MYRKIISILILVLIILTPIIFTSYDSHGQVVTSFETLKVGVDPTLPPFQFYDKGELTGLNIEILNSIAKKNNIKIDYIPMNKDVAIDKLVNNEIDLILGIRYDVSLLGKVEYTESVVQSIVCMLVKSENQKDIQSNLSSSTYLASVEKSSTELSFLNNLRRVNFNVAFNQEDAFELLLMNRADFLIGVKDTVEFLLNQHNLIKDYTILDSYTSPVEYLIGVRPGNTKLTNLINFGLSRLKLSGEYEDLYNKWIENSEVNIAKRLKNIIRTSIIVGIGLTIIFLLGIVWNLNLKKQVNLKTKELLKTNLDLEAQIIETKNNVELKNLIGESSPRGIVIFDTNGIISMFNSSALKITSLDIPPIGKPIYDIEPINLMLKDTIDEVLETNSGYTCEEFKYFKNNTSYIYRYMMYPLHDFNKVIRGIIITAEDITEEKRLKDQILEKEKNRALTQIVAGISHEIRNPLTSIKTFVELIPYKIDNKKFREELAIVVPEEIKRVDNLIKSLIDYSKPNSQNKTNFDLNEAIYSSIPLFSPTLESNDIAVNINIKNNLFVYCDKVQVKQCIINFLLNSIDAILEKKDSINDPNYCGKIHIEGYNKDNEITLTINDNGIGMSKRELEKAHDVFYTTKEKGTGLGLPLSIQMLNSNNCQVSIKSQKNEYTEITLKFSKQQERMNNK